VKRAVVYAAAIAVLLSGGAIAATEASAEARLADSQATVSGTQQQQIRERTCRFQWVDRATWTAREERRTLACVVDRFGPVEGGIPKVEQVGSCESGWNRYAENGDHDGRLEPYEYLGLFQHEATSWAGRVEWAMPDGWRVGPWARWTNSRAQIVVTIRMVHASGWGAWSCA
jgi:hypothetical protein